MTAAVVLALILLAALGLPLFVVLGAGGLYATGQMELDPIVLIVELNRLASSPNLTAIPMFTFAGVVLAAGGAPQRLIRLFNSLFGWLPGGLAAVALTACAFFTAFSGASGVTILALGGLLYPMLSCQGYRERFCLGLLTSSGSLGLLFPPSLAILLYGIVAGVNIDELFLAGIVPGTLLLVMLLLYSVFMGCKCSVPRQSFSIPELLRAVRAGIWDILLPVGIVVGIFGGYVTVNEAAACTAAYVLALESLIFRNINPARQLLPLLRDTSLLVGSILIILAAAMGLTNLLVDAQVPMQLLAWVKTHVDSQLEFLLLLNLFLLIVGAMMDIFSAIVVITPLILPLAAQFGVNPVHLGIIMLANLEIGYSTPPVGINLFIASQRFGKPILLLFRAALPFLAIMLVWLLIITYNPVLSLWWQKG
ncbi:TRAP transporter large permease [Thiohalobacter thiocyanaticus]|uniref:TRAP transporter large permease protein n=1 Tax=Thiohalobacter thiocyanaticus TaxID=585455 RepID=A0A426QE92_9GAMM|nr:TRAP transporter large permease subunit [Thiohalobacter thiocyanaticus]RRQ20080.1 TRAP transporter large permease subunit [Thiohalobacter thiocyanaticus]